MDVNRVAVFSLSIFVRLSNLRLSKLHFPKVYQYSGKLFNKQTSNHRKKSKLFSLEVIQTDACVKTLLYTV